MGHFDNASKYLTTKKYLLLFLLLTCFFVFLFREGILFSLTPLTNPNDPKGIPPNLAFLEILCEFTNKLMKQDKKTV